MNNISSKDEDNSNKNKPSNPKFFITSNWLIPSTRGNSDVDLMFSKENGNDGDASCDNSQAMLLNNDQSIVSDSNSQYFDAADDTNGRTLFTEHTLLNYEGTISRRSLSMDQTSSDDAKRTRLQIRLSKSMHGGFQERHKENLSTRLEPGKMNWLRIRYNCGMIINDTRVSFAIICLILINSITMGIATFHRDEESAGKKILEIIDLVFLIIYSIESVMQFIYFGWRMILDSWLAFDLFVVAVSWVTEFNSGVGGPFQIIRAFRIFRTFRLLTRIKVLRDLTAAIFEVLPRMGAIALLLSLVLYIFAVLFTELFREVEVDLAKPFGDLARSFFTCLEIMTLEWSSSARAALDMNKFAWFPFIVFIFITGFIVLNLIIAVTCDAVSLIDKVAREREALANGTILETPEQQLEFCQTSIIHLNDRVQLLQQSQQHLQDLMEVLAAELAAGCSTAFAPPTAIITQKSNLVNKKTATRSTVAFGGVNDSIHCNSDQEGTKSQAPLST
mmetsp:Transcript_22990/g.26237  ORF Transcript_22990/g.26237 Transcript_22990/m.26237 type:complete len:503 (-) Transcript_22990:234-1742(-)